MMEVVTASGEQFALGEVEASATVGIIDYSRRVTDDFGVTTVVQRGFARRMSVRLAVPSDDASALQRRLADLRATSARWIADDRFDWLSPTGFYKDFDIDMAVPPLSYCTLSVEGLAQTEAGADPGGDPAPDGHPSTLQLLQPYAVTEAILTASSVAEDDAPAWAAATGYTKGAKVLRQHRVYEALVANGGADPLAAGGQWLDTGPSKRWAPFDQALGTVAQADGQMTMRLETARIEGVALLDVKAATVRVQADGYDRTQAVTGGAVTFLDLGGKGRVTVTIAGAGAVTVGTLLIGRVVALGTTEASPTAGITDFSRKTVDDFGEVTIVKRGFAKRMTAKALIRTDALDIVANRIATVRAMPSLWIGQDGLDCLTVYGFFRDFSIEVGPGVSKLSLSIEGLSAADKTAPLVSWPDLGDPDGTKPEDNATNGATGNAPIGGVKQPDGTVQGARPAATVLADLQLNALTIAAEQMRNGTWRAEQDRINTNADGLTWRQVTQQLGLITELHQSFITEQRTVDSNGYAKAALSIRGDNAIAGFVGFAGGGRSGFKIICDEFSVADPDPNGIGEIYPLIIKDGVAYFDHIKVRQLDRDVAGTDNIQSDAIRQHYGSELAANVALPQNSGQKTRYLSVVVNKKLAESGLRIESLMRPRPGRDYACYFQIGRTTNGQDVVMDTIWYWVPSAVINDARSVRIPFYFGRTFAGLPAGQHTLWIEAVAYGGGNDAGFMEVGSNFDIEEVKR
ncbi:hypothetical protein ACQR50_09285 [Sphingomonas sp. Xoc002]|uniref:hypothetical protein n=1 Tax=Sphingomonas sp. Xoc002 TaxID=2837624 RepID=UPI003D177010